MEMDGKTLREQYAKLFEDVEDIEARLNVVNDEKVRLFLQSKREMIVAEIQKLDAMKVVESCQ
jgi:hypothetical protein